MGLSKEIVLTVKDYEIKLNRDIKFYENDTIDLCFSILEYGIEVKDGVAVNKLMPINALKAYMLIETPQGVDYAESTKVENNRVVFNLGNKYSQFIGIGRMQIVIKDNDGCRITLPEFPFEIRESINSNWDKDITVLSTEENEIIIDEFGRKIELKKISEMEEANILPIDSYSMILDNNENKKIKTNLITQKIENDLQLVNEQLDNIKYQNKYINKILGLGFEPSLVGRWWENNGYYCTTFPGAEIIFDVSNATYIKFSTKNTGSVATTTNKPHIAVIIDNNLSLYTRFEVDDLEHTIQLSSGKHTIRIVASGISNQVDKWVNHQGIGIKDIQTDGTFEPFVIDKKILFLGDSITEGQFNDGWDVTGFKSEISYANLTAYQLGYLPYQLGYGGTGLLTGTTTFPNALDLLNNNYKGNTANDDIENIKLIVINYGTNDTSKNDSISFKNAFSSYVKNVKLKYPSIPIIIIKPCTREVYPNEISDVAIEEQCYYLEINETIPLRDSVHPNKQGHEIIKNYLVDFINEKGILTNNPNSVYSYEQAKLDIENKGGYYRDFTKEKSIDSTVTLGTAKFINSEGITLVDDTYKTDGVIFNKDFLNGTLEIKLQAKTFVICLKNKDAINKQILYKDSSNIKNAKVVDGKLGIITDYGSFGITNNEYNYTIKLIKNGENCNFEILTSSGLAIKDSFNLDSSVSAFGDLFAITKVGASDNCKILSVKYTV